MICSGEEEIMVIKKIIKKAQAYIKKRPSAILIISFISLFIISSFLLVILEQKKVAEYIANAAYFRFGRRW